MTQMDRILEELREIKTDVKALARNHSLMERKVDRLHLKMWVMGVVVSLLVTAMSGEKRFTPLLLKSAAGQGAQVQANPPSQRLNDQRGDGDSMLKAMLNN